MASKQKQHRTVVSSRRAEPQPLLQQQHYYHHHQLEVSPQKTPTPPTLSPSPRPSSNNWQLLRQHMTLSVDNSDITVSSLNKPGRSSIPCGSQKNIIVIKLIC